VEKDAPALPSGKEALEEILDSQLSAVTFVMDYVQFEFDGPRLTAVTWPTVLLGDRLFRCEPRISSVVARNQPSLTEMLGGISTR
jgi:hypothetical protein